LDGTSANLRNLHVVSEGERPADPLLQHGVWIDRYTDLSVFETVFVGLDAFADVDFVGWFIFDDILNPPPQDGARIDFRRFNHRQYLVDPVDPNDPDQELVFELPPHYLYSANGYRGTFVVPLWRQ